MQFPPCRKSGKEVLAVAGLAKHYDEPRVFESLTFTIHRGEKVGLVGVNGAGKSTLLRLISRTEKPSAGEVRYGSNVDLAYFSQITAENIGMGQRTVWEEANAFASQVTTQEVRNLLGAFLFSGDDIDKPVDVLSGGEKSRLALLKTLLRAPNVLVLDEPTNHLDMRTREVFQQALAEYHGTVLLVSHDRFFLDNVVSRILELRDGRHYDYYGNYTFFLQKRAMDAAAAQAPNESPSSGDTGGKRGRRIREERKQQERYLRQLQRRRSEAEDRIMELENRKEELEAKLCVPDVYADPAKAGPLGTELDRISTELDGCYEEWNSLSDRVAAQEKVV
jgi:ATP-binding cassette subfamily F protein 3